MDIDFENLNFMMVEENTEDPNEIIADFVEMIVECGNDKTMIRHHLEDFFDEINRWSVKQYLIDAAKNAIGNLAIMDQNDTSFYIDIEFEDDTEDEDK